MTVVASAPRGASHAPVSYRLFDRRSRLRRFYKVISTCPVDMAEASRVLRIPQALGSQDSFVLVQVTRDGPSPLDLKLVGTEGTCPYVGSSELDTRASI